MAGVPEAPGPAVVSSPHEGEGLYLAQRGLIDDLIRAVCRRRAFSVEDAEEFAAGVHLRLVESGYEILRKFQGRSSLRTYLTIVIQRLALDYRTAQWGKWRPSAIARAGGPSAVRLEQLVVRDGVPLSAALDTVDREYGSGADRSTLARLAPRFPLRTRRSYVGEEVLEALAAGSPDTEAVLIRAEAEDRFRRVTARLRRLLDGLEDRDRLVLKMRFEQGMRVADIARLLRLDQKRLYRTIERTLAGLRVALEAEGIGSGDISATLADACRPAPANPSGAVRLSEGER